MRKNKKVITIESQEECEKQQQIEVAPRNKRIQKRTVVTRSSAKDRTIIVKQEQKAIENESFPIQFISLEQNNHICPLCLNLIAKAVTTVCGHSYCQFCLSEYLLFFQQCLQCSKPLRNSRFSYNRILDSLVQTISSSLSEDDKKKYKTRWEECARYSQNKKITSLEVGDILDVRDKDYIWCKARIYRTLCRVQQNRTKYIFVNYIGKPKHYNEQLSQNSQRLAPLGFYTQRQDVLHYQKNVDGELMLKAPLIFKNDQNVIMVEQ